MGTVIMMAAVATGGNENALASIDVPMTGHLIAVEWAANFLLNLSTEVGRLQLSFGSTYSSANDSRQVISNVNSGKVGEVTAAGEVLGQANTFTILPDLPVGMGERLYLHGSSSAGVTADALVCLHFDYDLDKVSVRRR